MESFSFSGCCLAHVSCVLRLNYDNDAFVAWLMPRVGIFPEILFRHTINEVKIGIFVDANNLATNFKVAVWIRWINDGECNLWIAQQIPILLAIFSLTETDIGAVKIKPDWCALWFTIWSNGCNMCQCCCMLQVGIFL